jgi:hypothetical protein
MSGHLKSTAMLIIVLAWIGSAVALNGIVEQKLAQRGCDKPWWMTPTVAILTPAILPGIAILEWGDFEPEDKKCP